MNGRRQTWSTVGDVATIALGATALWVAAEAVAELVIDSREISRQQAERHKRKIEEDRRLAPERAKIRARLARYLGPEPVGTYPDLPVAETGFEPYPFAPNRSRMATLKGKAAGLLERLRGR